MQAWWLTPLLKEKYISKLETSYIVFVDKIVFLTVVGSSHILFDNMATVRKGAIKA